MLHGACPLLSASGPTTVDEAASEV
jgi:hypothetical protein